MTPMLEGKLKGSDHWEALSEPANLCDIEIQMSGHGFITCYIGPDKRILSVENPLTGDIECMYRVTQEEPS